MKRVLAAAVLVSFMPTANAQDQGKADMTHNAEFRARYFQFQNPGGDESAQANEGFGQYRFKMDLGFRGNEKMSANATLMSADGFGKDGNAGNIAENNGGVGLNQVYGTWMTSEDLSFKVGRQNYQIADGTLMGINDWEQNPYSFDGLLANYEAEFGKFQFFAFKYRDDMTGTSASADPEHNAYGINFDLKTMPEWLKGVNVHVVKDVQDAIDASTAPANPPAIGDGKDLLRYGLMAKFAFSIVDITAWYEANTGTYKNINAGTKTETDASQNLMAAEVGVGFANFMNSRVSVKYHKDSGTSATSTKAETYDGYFTEKHCSVGCMDLFGFGNMTFIKVGWDFKPSDATEVGLAYWMLSQTEADSGATAGIHGAGLPAEQADKDDLGSEIDLWATHKYDGGLSTTLRLGYYTPGDVYTANNGPDDNIMHVMLEGKWNF